MGIGSQRRNVSAGCAPDTYPLLDITATVELPSGDRFEQVPSSSSITHYYNYENFARRAFVKAILNVNTCACRILKHIAQYACKVFASITYVAHARKRALDNASDTVVGCFDGFVYDATDCSYSTVVQIHLLTDSPAIRAKERDSKLLLLPSCYQLVC
eukprot:scaffold896_cov250-Pinguiococcus_pyrenoidosus.AAC.2